MRERASQAVTITVPLSPRDRRPTSPLGERLCREMGDLIADPATFIFPPPDWTVQGIARGQFRGFDHDGIHARRQYVREGATRIMRVLASADGTMLLLPDAAEEEVDGTQHKLAAMSMEGDGGGACLIAEKPFDGHVIAVAAEYDASGDFSRAVARHKDRATGAVDLAASSLLFATGQNISARFAGIDAALCSKGTNSRIDWVLEDERGEELIALRDTPEVLSAKAVARYILGARNRTLAAAKIDEDAARSTDDY